MERGRDGEREGEREGGRERAREGGREGGREKSGDIVMYNVHVHVHVHCVIYILWAEAHFCTTALNFHSTRMTASCRAVPEYLPILIYTCMEAFMDTCMEAFMETGVGRKGF